MKAEDFDKKFDEGVSIVKHLDLSRARRPKQEQKRVNVDFLMSDNYNSRKLDQPNGYLNLMERRLRWLQTDPPRY
jgi:hypothetical protein